jgi:hypothetical protein
VQWSSPHTASALFTQPCAWNTADNIWTMKSFVAKNFNVEGAQFDAQVIAAPCPACLVIVLTLWLSLC